MHKLPFAVLAITLVFALAGCKNPWINELLKSPSELSSLEVVAFAGETKLQGGAAFEPPFSAAVRDYLVYVPLETSRFTVNTGYDGNGTVTWTTAGMDGAVSSTSFTFDFFGIEDTINLTLSVERENMGPGEYRLAVTRTDNIPPPKVIALNITPSVGTYFLGEDVVPVINVLVEPPTDGGTLAYQWFRNEDDNNVTGSMLYGATGTTYTLKNSEAKAEGVAYYYVEITKTLDGKTSKLASATRSVTFLDRNEELHEKSAGGDKSLDRSSKNSPYWIPVPAGTVSGGTAWQAGTAGFTLPWSTDGFKMGKYPVTYELWELVRQYAEAENYQFANVGNQGAHRSTVDGTDNTESNTKPIGTNLHPVTMINYRDAIVWCNALSEMEGRAPVYRDSSGNVLRDSRKTVESLIDAGRMAGKNGYRLPTPAEIEYATRGGVPHTSTPWTYTRAGTNDTTPTLIDDYLWEDKEDTGVVGSKFPNSIQLYDMMGMVQEWLYVSGSTPWQFSRSFNHTYTQNIIQFNSTDTDTVLPRKFFEARMYYGLRVLRYEVE